MDEQTRPGRDALSRRLREQAPDVAYDVEDGLRRHRALVEAQAPLPDWAREHAAPARSRGVARRVGWLGGMLLVVAALWLRGRAPASSPSAAAGDFALARHVSASRHGAASAAPAAHVAREPVSSARPGEPLRSTAHESADDTVPLVEHAGTASQRAASADFTRGTQRTALSASQVSRPEQAPDATPLSAVSERRTGLRDERGASSSGTTSLPARLGKRVQAQAPRDAEEMRQLAEAERLLAVAPEQTLRLARVGARRFANGYFVQERAYLEVLSLFALGRRDEAHLRAASFLRDYPDGPYNAKVQRAQLQHPAR